MTPSTPTWPRWRLSRTTEVVLDRPRVMAILNVTPDSFSDGGCYRDSAAAAEAATRFVTEGADVIDIGGESTRPGAARVDAAEQTSRVVPVIRAIRGISGPAATVPITIDTTIATVARAALDAGADAVNDVSAGTEDSGMLALCAQRGCGIVLMHRLTPPDRDSYSDRYARPPEYADVVSAVAGFLSDRLAAARHTGIDEAGVLLDPGLGFGKTVEQNLELIRRTGELAALGRPVLSGASRKSFVGRISVPDRDTNPQERLAGSIALSVLHLEAGARVFRVHDVADQARALAAAWALIEQGKSPR